MNAAPEPSHQLCIDFAGNRLQIYTNCQAAADVAEFVFRRHVGVNTAADTATLLEVQADTEGGGYQLRIDGELASVANCLADLPVVLMQLAQRYLIVAETRQAMFHAALLTCNDLGVLLPAVAGSGKTTLSSWLLGQGYGFYSDELAAVSENGLSDGLSRPLNIKPGSFALAESFDWLIEARQAARVSCGVMLLPWARNPQPRVPLRVIVSPKFVPDSPLKVEALTPGSCAMVLMGSLLNARNLPKHGLTLARTLASKLPGYRITYSRLEDASYWLANTLAS